MKVSVIVLTLMLKLVPTKNAFLLTRRTSTCYLCRKNLNIITRVPHLPVQGLLKGFRRRGGPPNSKGGRFGEWRGAGVPLLRGRG